MFVGRYQKYGNLNSEIIWDLKDLSSSLVYLKMTAEQRLTFNLNHLNCAYK